jgi:hypothetical protein
MYCYLWAVLDSNADEYEGYEYDYDEGKFKFNIH